MKQWNKRSVLLGFLVAWMAFSPVFLFAAESQFSAHSFLCQYLNFVLQPVGLCQKLPATPTVIPGIALSPVQKNFIVASVLVVPFAVVPQVLGVATSGPMLVPAQSVVIDPTNKQNSATAALVGVSPYLQSMLFAQQFTLNHSVSMSNRLKVLTDLCERQRAHDGAQYTRTAVVIDDTATALQNGTADFSGLSVAGKMTLTGAFRDGAGAAGAVDSVLQRSGSGVLWVATSSLGIVGGSGGSGTGTVSSVAFSAPTGFTVSGSPVTSVGTLSFSYATGYEGLQSASSTIWNNFYATPSGRIGAVTGLNWSGNTLSINTAGDWSGTFDGQIGAYYLYRSNQTGTQATATDIAALFSDGVTIEESATGSGVVSLNARPSMTMMFVRVPDSAKAVPVVAL